MRRFFLSGLGLALGLVATSARGDDVQWHPVPAVPTGKAIPAVTLVAIALLRTASRGFASINGTCL